MTRDGGSVAVGMYERLEDWYDARPDASFEELEDELRRQGRGLMGSTLETLIVGRDSGFDVEPPETQDLLSNWPRHH